MVSNFEEVITGLRQCQEKLFSDNGVMGCLVSIEAEVEDVKTILSAIDDPHAYEIIFLLSRILELIHIIYDQDLQNYNKYSEKLCEKIRSGSVDKKPIYSSMETEYPIVFSDIESNIDKSEHYDLMNIIISTPALRTQVFVDAIGGLLGLSKAREELIFTRNNISAEIEKARSNKCNIEKGSKLSKKLTEVRAVINFVGEILGEQGGSEKANELGYEIFPSFTPDIFTHVGKNRFDAVGISRNYKNVVIFEFKGGYATLSNKPVNTMYGKKRQGDPDYVRDRMTKDSRLAECFRQNIDVWQGIKDGNVKIMYKVISTKPSADPKIIKSSEINITMDIVSIIEENINSAVPIKTRRKYCN